MRNTIVLFAAVMLASVAVHGQEPGRFDVQLKVPLESKELKGAPYSAEVVNDHTQALADGNRIVQHSTGRVYRDKDGRVRREEDRPSGGPAISIVDPVAGISYSLDPEKRVAWKTAAFTGVAIMTRANLAKVEARAGEATGHTASGEVMTYEVNGGRVEIRHAGGGDEQRTQELLPSRMLEGLSVTGHRTVTIIPAGAIGNDLPISVVSEEWISPDLQVLVLTQRTDPRNGDSTYRLLNIVRSEPDIALFQVPADYTVKETGIRRFEEPR